MAEEITFRTGDVEITILFETGTIKLIKPSTRGKTQIVKRRMLNGGEVSLEAVKAKQTLAAITDSDASPTTVERQGEILKQVSQLYENRNIHHIASHGTSFGM